MLMRQVRMTLIRAKWSSSSKLRIAGSSVGENRSNWRLISWELRCGLKRFACDKTSLQLWRAVFSPFCWLKASNQHNLSKGVLAYWQKFSTRFRLCFMRRLRLKFLWLMSERDDARTSIIQGLNADSLESQRNSFLLLIAGISNTAIILS